MLNPQASTPSATGPEWRKAFRGAKRNTAHYPMMVMRLSDVLAIKAEDGLPPHQLALKRGLLHEFLPGEGTVLFVSHQVRAARGTRYTPALFGMLTPYTVLAPARAFAPRRAQWLGDEHPDPAFVQFDVLQSALRLLAAGETDVHSHPQLVVTGGSIKMLGAEFKALLAPPNVYVWYAGVPARPRRQPPGCGLGERLRDARARARSGAASGGDGIRPHRVL
jgi:hypothetical protein